MRLIPIADLLALALSGYAPTPRGPLFTAISVSSIYPSLSPLGPWRSSPSSPDSERPTVTGIFAGGNHCFAIAHPSGVSLMMSVIKSICFVETPDQQRTTSV